MGVPKLRSCVDRRRGVNSDRNGGGGVGSSRLCSGPNCSAQSKPLGAWPALLSWGGAVSTLPERLCEGGALPTAVGPGTSCDTCPLSKGL